MVKLKTIRGFALLEVCIALMVLGILVGLGLPAYFQLINQKKRQETLQRQEILIRRLAAYLRASVKLPCPAEPGSDGQARPTCATISESIGIIPFQTLGIDPVEAKDGYGRWMTYVVARPPPLLPKGGSPMLTDYPSARLSSGCPIADADQAFYKNKDPDFILSVDVKEYVHNKTTPHERIAVILISHGESGYGAFGGSHKILSGPAGHYKKMNARLDQTLFYKLPLSTRPDSYFDDIVRFETRTGLKILGA